MTCVEVLQHLTTVEAKAAGEIRDGHVEHAREDLVEDDAEHPAMHRHDGEPTAHEARSDQQVGALPMAVEQLEDVRGMGEVRVHRGHVLATGLGEGLAQGGAVARTLLVDHPRPGLLGALRRRITGATVDHQDLVGDAERLADPAAALHHGSDAALLVEGRNHETEVEPG